jgi:hypothetical protein
MQTTIPLVLADESSAGPFVTGGALRLPAARVDDAVRTLAEIKANHGLPEGARIHCRILFAGDARRKSPFKALTPDDVHELLKECVIRMLTLGGTWWGAWVNKTTYPRHLQIKDGKPFAIMDKHLAGMVAFGALVMMEHFVGPEYRLGFDPDPTKIDWGMMRRTQATHFARIHSNVADLPDEHKPLLEMADVAAYTLVQSLMADFAPGNRKAARFPELLKLTAMRSSEFAYTPEGRH